MPVGNDEFNFDSQSLKGVLLLAWRVIMLLGLLGVAFQAGAERARIREQLINLDKGLYAMQDINPRVKSLENWQIGIMSLAESRDIRMRNLESDGASREVRLDGLESRMRVLEDRYENLKKAENGVGLPSFKRLVER
jgi:hypothetical protein